MKPVLAKVDSTLSLEVKIPEPCLIALLFKLDHQARRAFGLEPNTTVKHKVLFRKYWRKLIDQEENHTELADMEAVSAFLQSQSQAVPVDLQESQDLRDSMVMSSRQGSDITVLPEEIAVISVGSEDSTAAQQRKEKALKRREELLEQQKHYLDYVNQFVPHDAHLKTHKEFVQTQKAKLKTVYKVQRFFRHHRQFVSLDKAITARIAAHKTI